MEGGEKLRLLLRKYMNGMASQEEEHLLSELIEGCSQSSLSDLLEKMLQEEFVSADPLPQSKWDPVIQQILTEAQPAKRRSPVVHLVSGWKKYAAVAAGLLLIAISSVLYNRSSVTIAPVSQPVAVMKSDIPPAPNAAILTLADGKSVVLDSGVTGNLAVQGNVRVVKSASGIITYDRTMSPGNREEVYNSITTPRGSRHEVVLSDGTHVWLNAASSLRFPAVFTGAQRKVTLSGEGYFEVAKNTAMPFVIEVGKMQVKVLGTHLNIMAYPEEEAIRTTLIEGSLRVISGNDSLTIKPGEQAGVREGERIALRQGADLEEVLAWKNGIFDFNGSNIVSILNQVSRWYDVDVEYAGKITSGHYRGKPSRSLSLMEMLKVMEYSGVRFELKGKKLIVMD